MANIISHQGVVTEVEDTRVFVRIVQTSACSSCSAKGFCSAADSKEKIIEVNSPDRKYAPGDTVLIYGETSMGMKAVLFAFVIPFLVLIISLFTAMQLTGGNELFSAGISFLLLLIYYIILAINKHKLVRQFTFKVKTINS